MPRTTPRWSTASVGFRFAVAIVAILSSPEVIHVQPAQASRAGQLTQIARVALDRLYVVDMEARRLGHLAKAILVFPRIVKAGFMAGAQTGEGVLFVKNRERDFYRISTASFGFQIGAHTFGYALFLISNSALDYLGRSQGWAIGTGPSIVIVDQGLAKSVNTTTLSKDVYAVRFNHRGLMAGAGLEGSKIGRVSLAP